jgi:hypothetical protein
VWLWKDLVFVKKVDQAEDLEKAPEVQPRRAAFGLNSSHVSRYFE